VGLAIREEIIDNHADNGKEEDDKRPKHLVGNRAIRLENLDCNANMSAPVLPCKLQDSMLLTPGNDI